MSPKQDRSNAYYEERLKVTRPGIYSDYLAGKYPSLRKALLAAGIKKPRTRVQELKNAWLKASPVEQREFARWLRGQIGAVAISTSKSAGPTTLPIAVDQRLEPWAASRIETIMDRRHLRMGDVMQELGASRLDASLGQALRRGSCLQPVVLKALEKWISDNAAV